MRGWECLERHGVGEKTVEKLVETGIHGLAHLLEMSDEELVAIEGVGPKTAAALLGDGDLEQRLGHDRDLLGAGIGRRHAFSSSATRRACSSAGS